MGLTTHHNGPFLIRQIKVGHDQIQYEAGFCIDTGSFSQRVTRSKARLDCRFSLQTTIWPSNHERRQKRERKKKKRRKKRLNYTSDQYCCVTLCVSNSEHNDKMSLRILPVLGESGKKKKEKKKKEKKKKEKKKKKKRSG